MVPHLRRKRFIFFFPFLFFFFASSKGIIYGSCSVHDEDNGTYLSACLFIFKQTIHIRMVASAGDCDGKSCRGRSLRKTISIRIKQELLAWIDDVNGRMSTEYHSYPSMT